MLCGQSRQPAGVANFVAFLCSSNVRRQQLTVSLPQQFLRHVAVAEVVFFGICDSISSLSSCTCVYFVLFFWLLIKILIINISIFFPVSS